MVRRRAAWARLTGAVLRTSCGVTLASGWTPVPVAHGWRAEGTEQNHPSFSSMDSQRPFLGATDGGTAIDLSAASYANRAGRTRQVCTRMDGGEYEPGSSGATSTSFNLPLLFHFTDFVAGVVSRRWTTEVRQKASVAYTRRAQLATWTFRIYSNKFERRRPSVSPVQKSGGDDALLRLVHVAMRS
jgi:hypothetical protein